MNTEEIFHAAVEIPDPVKRAEYLDRACAGDEKLRAEVDALLKWHGEAGEFLEIPALGPEVVHATSAPPEGPGTVIGRYKLLEQIGEGGMATVYMAEQEEPSRRRVALKIIKPGMDTKQVIARFEAERQALALMDHPNIAKVFEAGTTEAGRPYFVMELITGVSLTEYCDQNHLSTRDRLALFLQVCDAVQHAHQKGIIHRDLKPSNVMVTHHDGKPLPKVIDFGIAKATNQRLTEKTLFTRYAQIIGTPAYMSPEQAELSDLDIDTRSDIYSLGVLLYELLTGTTPFSEEELRKAGYVEMQRVIREQEPPKPSTKLSTLGETLTGIAKRRSSTPSLLKKAVRGDLDWIVMKSLEKDRTRRYGTVSTLLEDIQRHLRSEPVSAGPPGAWYRTTKFVRRHRTLLAASAAVAMTVVAGLVASVTMYVRAEHAQSETELVSDFLTEHLLSSTYPEKAKGQEVTVRFILDNAVKDIDQKLAGSPLSEAKVRETIGLAYQKLGDYKAAESHMERAVEIRRLRLGEGDPATLSSLHHLGSIYSDQGRYQEAEALLLKALEARKRILGETHPDTLESMCALGWEYVYKKTEGRFERAEELFRRAMEAGRLELGEGHRTVLDAMNGLSFYYTIAYRLDEAESLARTGLDICDRAYGKEDVQRAWFLGTIVWVHGQRAAAVTDTDVALAREVLEIDLRMLGERHTDTAYALRNLGWIYLRQGRYDEALEPLVKSVKLCREIKGETHPATLYLMNDLAALYRRRGQDQEADDLLIRIVDGCQREHGDKYPHTWRYRSQLVQRSRNLRATGIKQYETGQCGDAVATFMQLARIRPVLQEEEALADSALLAMSLRQLGRDEEAQETLHWLREAFKQSGSSREERYLYEAERVFARERSPEYEVWDLLHKGALDGALEIVGRLQAQMQPDARVAVDNLAGMARAVSKGYCLRAGQAEGRGDFAEAIRDYEIAVRVDPGFARAHDRLACLLATCQREGVRDGVHAVDHGTRSSELTDWKNPYFIHTLAAACAETGDFPRAVQHQKQAIELLSQKDREKLLCEYEGRLQLYQSGRPYHRSMVARWDFEQSNGKAVLDSSGNELHARLIGSAHVVHDGERPGKVLGLDGEDAWVDCGADSRFSLSTEITLACWAKTQKFDKPFQTIISKGNSAWRLSRERTTATLHFACSGLAVPNDMYGAVRGHVDVNDGRWHHLAGVYDGTTTRLYVDGKLDVSSEASGNINANPFKVLIGKNDETKTLPSFNGFLDDMRIYNYALSEAEIKALCSSQGPDGVEK